MARLTLISYVFLLCSLYLELKNILGLKLTGRLSSVIFPLEAMKYQTSYLHNLNDIFTLASRIITAVRELDTKCITAAYPSSWCGC